MVVTLGVGPILLAKRTDHGIQQLHSLRRLTSMDLLEGKFFVGPIQSAYGAPAAIYLDGALRNTLGTPNWIMVNTMRSRKDDSSLER